MAGSESRIVECINLMVMKKVYWTLVAIFVAAVSIFSGFLRPDLPETAFSSIVSAIPTASTAAGRTVSPTVSIAIEGNTLSLHDALPILICNTCLS